MKNLNRKGYNEIQKKVLKLEHLGDVGGVKKDNDGAIKDFEEIIKKI